MYLSKFFAVNRNLDFVFVNHVFNHFVKEATESILIELAIDYVCHFVGFDYPLLMNSIVHLLLWLQLFYGSKVQYIKRIIKCCLYVVVKIHI
ncbi:hypothetical protein PJIAN_4914 [Paludibacter jiangxiensis]|uniref:Uncharacterized protein n=1 Tax=Paludibacter jiangxiensis TaxID=681398 RepID=A0A161M6L7_9BACT|nr:hypothetical protein PJIAN_4914 [Paludibacter jiangxiensis]